MGPKKEIGIVGFGAQARAWIPLLLAGGYDVSVHLREGSLSAAPARELGARVASLTELERGPEWIAFLMSDGAIGSVYREFLQASRATKAIVLAHGYSLYSEELVLNSAHRLVMLAPKAIGPELLKAGLQARKDKAAHGLKAAVYLERESDRPALQSLAHALGFSDGSLISTDPVTEAKGDLISEQLLLCGGLFTLLELAQKAMRGAGVPEALIREECVSELKLIADLLKERGVPGTLSAISDAAKAGAVGFRNRAGDELKKIANAQVADISSRKFAREFASGDWKAVFQDWMGEFQK